MQCALYKSLLRIVNDATVLEKSVLPEPYAEKRYLTYTGGLVPLLSARRQATTLPVSDRPMPAPHAPPATAHISANSKPPDLRPSICNFDCEKVIHARPVKPFTTNHANQSKCLATVLPTDAVTGKDPFSCPKRTDEVEGNGQDGDVMRSTDRNFADSYNTTSNRTRIVKTPGGELRILHIKKRGTAPKCGDCGTKLPGVSSNTPIRMAIECIEATRRQADTRMRAQHPWWRSEKTKRKEHHDACDCG